MSSSSRADSDSQRTAHFLRSVKSAKKPHHAVLRVRLASQDQDVKIVKNTTRNWNVNVLLNNRCWILSLEKTLKTSLITTTTRNWIVKDLLGRLRNSVLGDNFNS